MSESSKNKQAIADNDTKTVVEGIKIIENRNLMMVFWIFVSCSGVFGLIQNWPSNAQNCVSLSVDFGPHSCGILGFTIYSIEPILYSALLLSLFFINFDVIDANDEHPILVNIYSEKDKEIQLQLQRCQSSNKLLRIQSLYWEDHELSAQTEDSSADYGSGIEQEYLWELIKEKTSKCEELLFPICILKALIVIEIFVVLYSPNLYYIIQIISDFCRYLLWLFYAAIITKLKFEHKIKHSRTKVLNILFLIMAMVSLCIMTYVMLGKDLHFAQLRHERHVPQLGFVQIILESTLLLELVSIVIENLLHVYCTCFHHSYHIINDAPDISHLLGHKKPIFVWIVFGLSQIIFGTLKTLQNDYSKICSNFTLLSHESMSDCLGYFWFAQLSVNIVCLGIVMSELSCNCHILNLELVVFPFIIGILMLFCEFMFALTSANQFYFIQIFIDITGYSVLFIEALYAYRFFMYIHVHSSWVALKRGMDPNIKYIIGGVNNAINLKLLLIFIGLLFCLCAAIVTLILNFYTDVAKIESSALYLSQTNDDVTVTALEEWMFLQIVLENTLILEYIRILAKSIDIKYLL